MSNVPKRPQATQVAQLAPEITQVIDLVAEILVAERRLQQSSTSPPPSPKVTEQKAA